MANTFFKIDSNNDTKNDKNSKKDISISHTNNILKSHSIYKRCILTHYNKINQ